MATKQRDSLAPDVDALATRLIAAYDSATTIAPLSQTELGFDVAVGYRVLHEIERRRRERGWVAVGRKIGFTNRTIWARYGVYQPMWAHTWAHTVHHAPEARAKLSLTGLVQPRIEPEVVFKLRSSVPATADARSALACVEWMAPGFELVQSHFPDWRFAAADCTAAFGLHGTLVIGPPVALTEANRDALGNLLTRFTLTLRRGTEVVDVGVGANVLDSPALALVHLARVLAQQPEFPPLGAGEVITTGTLTDAFPVAAGETWSSDYGMLGLSGMELTFLE
jgi:2-oxo-3-hexenedioate decarboxylase